jgi:tetratricopeptide (TPR) repeat protein
LYGLKGYAYDKLNDSVNAKAAFEKFFAAQKPEKIGPTDLETYARILLKFPGNEALAGSLIDKGIAVDTTEAGKVSLMKVMATKYEAQKLYANAAEWYKKILDIKKSPSKTDIFNAANNFSRGGNYQAAIDGWAGYVTKYPAETYGHYMTAVTHGKVDTTMAMGSAVPSYQKVIEIGEAQWATDSAKVKVHLLNAYKYLIAYSANIKKDKKGALDYCTKYLLKEPTDAEVASIQKQLNAAGSRPPAPAAKPGTAKPAAGTKATTAPAKAPVVKKK